MTSHTIPQPHPDSQTLAQNLSIPEGCRPVRFSQMEFLPWNNSDTIVSQEVEILTRKVRFAMMEIALFLGGPANILNMAVFLKQGLRDRVNLLLFALSLADVIFLISATLLYGEEFYLNWDAGTNAGPVLIFMVNHNLGCFLSCCFVSFVLSAIIACERCYCVLSPLKYQTVMRTRTTALIILTVYAVILSLNYVAVFRYHFACVYDLDTGLVSDMLGQSPFYLNNKDFIDSVENVFFGVGLPVAMAAVVITATAVTISKLKQTMAWRSETASSSSISAKEVGLTKMLIGTSLLLIICVLPSCVFRVACLFLPEVSSGRRNQNLYWMGLWITEMFLFINSTCNFCIYYAMGSRYRDTFWALFQCKQGGGKSKNDMK